MYWGQLQMRGKKMDRWLVQVTRRNIKTLQWRLVGRWWITNLLFPWQTTLKDMTHHFIHCTSTSTHQWVKILCVSSKKGNVMQFNGAKEKAKCGFLQLKRCNYSMIWRFLTWLSQSAFREWHGPGLNSGQHLFPDCWMKVWCVCTQKPRLWKKKKP